MWCVCVCSLLDPSENDMELSNLEQAFTTADVSRESLLGTPRPILVSEANVAKRFGGVRVGREDGDTNVSDLDDTRMDLQSLKEGDFDLAETR